MKRFWILLVLFSVSAVVEASDWQISSSGRAVYSPTPSECWRFKILAANARVSEAVHEQYHQQQKYLKARDKARHARLIDRAAIITEMKAKEKEKAAAVKAKRLETYLKTKEANG